MVEPTQATNATRYSVRIGATDHDFGSLEEANQFRLQFGPAYCTLYAATPEGWYNWDNKDSCWVKVLVASQEAETTKTSEPIELREREVDLETFHILRAGGDE